MYTGLGVRERGTDYRIPGRAAPHYTGDGTTLHQTTQEFLVLVASPKTNHELEADLSKEIQVDVVRIRA
jgi:hypothetical protein